MGRPKSTTAKIKRRTTLGQPPRIVPGGELWKRLLRMVKQGALPIDLMQSDTGFGIRNEKTARKYWNMATEAIKRSA